MANRKCPSARQEFLFYCSDISKDQDWRARHQPSSPFWRERKVCGDVPKTHVNFRDENSSSSHLYTKVFPNGQCAHEHFLLLRITGKGCYVGPDLKKRTIAVSEQRREVRTAKTNHIAVDFHASCDVKPREVSLKERIQQRCFSGTAEDSC